MLWVINENNETYMGVWAYSHGLVSGQTRLRTQHSCFQVWALSTLPPRSSGRQELSWGWLRLLSALKCSSTELQLLRHPCNRDSVRHLAFREGHLHFEKSNAPNISLGLTAGKGLSNAES